MMGYGPMTSQLIKDRSFMLTRISTKEHSSMARNMAKEFIIIQLVENIKVNGYMT